MKLKLFLVTAAYILQTCLSTTCPNVLNVSGGKFIPNTYRKSYVIRAQNGTGPKMCIRDCMLQQSCNAVNFRLIDFTCELLNSSTTDKIQIGTDFIFSELTDWTMVSTGISLSE